jgi:predicted metalloprotease with PDZ domain
MNKRSSVSGLICLLAFIAPGALPASAADLTIRLDAREAPRKHMHTELTLAVKSGALTLVFPKWIPGEHAPSGPLDSMIGLEIRANGKPLVWTRDPLDMYALALNVPRGADHLDIAIDSGLATSGDGFSAAPTSSAQLAVLPWNEFVLLPKGRDAATITTLASVMPPAGWSLACALDSKTLADGSVQFEEASLARLIDSPVQIGRHMERIELAGSAPLPGLSHSISIAADSAAALKVPDDFARGYSKLVAEAGVLFGTRMYRHYTWLLTLSDHVAHFGLEHHESSDNRREENALSEPDLREGVAGLLGHEYVHSWNGKFRRPLGLVSPDYQKPMDGSLLWVYEGLTELWGEVLPTRAGLVSTQTFREWLAGIAGDFDIEPGDRWRPLADTAVEAQKLYDAPDAWKSSRRDTDFYEASVLLWLDVDSELRARTGGRASLDDFMRSFYAGPGGAPALKPYVEQDIYKTLATIAPLDWRPVIRRHLDSLGPAVLLAALERSGWKLAYTPQKNSWVEYYQKHMKTTERAWSIGLRLDDKGVILDAIEGRAAARGGAGPGMTLVAVNGRKFSPEVLDAAIAAAAVSRKPIELLVQSDDYYRTLKADYFDGPRFPHIVRIEGRPDTLSEVLKSRLH